MTLTHGSINWLEDHYPDAATRQEAVRMAISDARQHHIGLENLKANSQGDAILPNAVEMDREDE